MQMPIVLALAVCDDVWIDPNSRKQTLLGMYGSIATPIFPHVAPLMVVYACLTECPPEIEIEVRIVDVDEEHEPVTSGRTTIRSPDIRATVQGSIKALNVVFPVPGEYRVQLLAAGELLLERRLVLFQIGGENDRT